MTQERLAELLGCDRRTVARLEAGKVPATLDLVEDLARAFQCSPDEFLVSLYAEEPDYGPDADASLKRLADAVAAMRDEDLNRAISRRSVLRAAAAIGLLPDEDVEWLTWVAIALSWQPIVLRMRDLPPILVRDSLFPEPVRKGTR
jgi:transcriptional regulator with XRE-family HTH domain